MTTKPKAKKFRIRRTASLTVSRGELAQTMHRDVPLAQANGPAVLVQMRSVPVQTAAPAPSRPITLVVPARNPSAPERDPAGPADNIPAATVSGETGPAAAGSAGPRHTAPHATTSPSPEAAAPPTPARTSAPATTSLPPAQPGPVPGQYDDATKGAAEPASSKPGKVVRVVSPPEADDQMFAASAEDGFGAQSYLTRSGAPATTQSDPSGETELDQIRRESLTGRQLRMARRLAQKHGLPATSDFDAVRLLRRQGIDPFQRSNMLELVVGDSQGKPDGGTPVQLPQTIKPVQLPAPEVRQDHSRAHDIMNIQRDIARRRRRKLALLMARMAFFVFLPTLLAGIYFYSIATPLFSTRSEFLIQQAQPTGGGQLGGLLTGTQFATSQDSIAVQSYLNSREAMLRLDEEMGFKAHFSQPFIDPVQRLAAGASSEKAYRIYQRNVKIGYDPTEGIIKMEVIAADPATSAAFANALISYAEEQIDQLTQRLREDQMRDARATLVEAEDKMLASQREVVELQEKFKVLSSEVEVSMLASQISTLDAQLSQERLRLQELLANAQPNKARVDPIRNTIANLEAQIGDLRAKMSIDGSDGLSLAKMQGELLVAQANVQTRQLMLAQALQSQEMARVEANRQVRYLSTVLRPVAPDEASYPRAFEDTAVAFMIFAGIYLMLSMTASILREQVSA